MEITKQDIIKNITFLLNLYTNHIHSLGSLGLFDFNKSCEDIFCDLLNQIHSLDLKNLNYTSYNYPAIDLGDSNAGICYQITSSNEKKKIDETIEKFNENKLGSTYDNLIILIIGNKKAYKTNFPEYVQIIDINDLIINVSSIQNRQILININTILSQTFVKYGFIQGIDNNLLSNYNEATIIYGSTYESYFKHLEATTQQMRTEYTQDLVRFADQLKNLPVNIRQFINFAISKQYKGKKITRFTETIDFSLTAIISFLGNKENIVEIIKYLINMGYVSYDEDYPDIFSFRFYNSSGEYCVLETIASYCIAKKIDITALVEGLDFRILD